LNHKHVARVSTRYGEIRGCGAAWTRPPDFASLKSGLWAENISAHQHWFLCRVFDFNTVRMRKYDQFIVQKNRLHSLLLCACLRISGLLRERLTGDREMEAVWGAVLSFLFVLATLYGYNATGPSTSELKEQLEKQQKELKEQLEKDQKDQKEKKEELEKQQKEKTEKREKSNKGSSEKASKKKVEFCINDCPEAWRIRP
jgi:hypothetical protein